MASVDIILQPVKGTSDDVFIYPNSYSQTIDIIKAENRPNGYMYHNHKPKKDGPYTLKSVRMYSNNDELDFGIHLPLNNVSGFFVYYKMNDDNPLLICIQTISSEKYITHRYFCPRNKYRKSWMSVPDLVLDPKWSSSFWEIRKKLNEQSTLMEGVIIDIEKTYTYGYKNGSVYIHTSRSPFNSYQVYTQELASHEPFYVKEIKFKETTLEIENLNDSQVIAVHSIGTRHSNLFNPISVCVVKFRETKKENDYEWYYRNDLDSMKWTKEKRSFKEFDIDTIRKYINELYDNLYELDIHIDKGVFHYKETQSFTNRGIRGKFISLHTKKRFKKFIYSLDAHRNFKIKTLTIDGQTQIISPKKVYLKFYIVCDDKYDKDYPLFMCFPDSKQNYQWYTRIHYGSNNWILSEELKYCKPEEYIDDDILDKAYLKLFWINIDIDYDKKLNLEDYVKNNRYIAKNVTIHGDYTLIETVNYNSYPFYVKIVEKEKTIESVTNGEKMISVCVIYDNYNKPRFIVFEHAELFPKFVWYSRKDYSDEWKLYKDLKEEDPKEYIHKLSLSSFKAIEEEEKTNTITAQALGTTVGTAACCGLGYFIYTNVSSFSGMISSIFS
nr:hypothetical protein MACL_00002427 [Theileria orientalis]